MKPFAALDEVLNNRTLATVASCELVGKEQGDFQPLFAAGAANGERALASGDGHGAPQVELLRENGRIQKILVTCACGEQIVLDCAY